MSIGKTPERHAGNVELLFHESIRLPVDVDDGRAEREQFSTEQEGFGL